MWLVVTVRQLGGKWRLSRMRARQRNGSFRPKLANRPATPNDSFGQQVNFA
jgi:hypothetical protein